jgi:hypothetical protein
MTAQEVVELFVPIANLLQLEQNGHVFINGHRGCGKSMMFRFMCPDCQILHKGGDLTQLPYFGVYLSIKATDLNLPEFRRLEGQTAGYVLSEHVLVNYFVSKAFQSLSDFFVGHISKSDGMTEFSNFCQSTLFRRLKSYGVGVGSELLEVSDPKTLLTSIIEIFNGIHRQVLLYLKQLSFSNTVFPYQGPLFGFYDLLQPLLLGIKKLAFMPDAPIYLLVDDADNLTRQQTEVLNTWVSYRTTADFSLKISTQLNYKTWLTTTGRRIEAPHDYSEINISSVHTGPIKDKYPDWVEKIVTKRLELHDIHTTAKAFFPVDEKQEEAIRTIAEEYILNWQTASSRGYRPRDDAYRYARPEYIKRLTESKQGSQYKYAGFDQLVHISSGIIRYFLDPAAKMFSKALKQSGTAVVSEIPPGIQDEILREESAEILLGDFDKLIRDLDLNDSPEAPELVKRMIKLRNLIYTVGALFHQLLRSNRAERRVFSFAISDEPDQELLEVLRLGVEYGYFYVSSIGTKSGFGRTNLFILSRRLAPFFKLDPTGVSGYKFVTSSFLVSAMNKPVMIQHRLRNEDLDSIVLAGQQGSLFAQVDS